MLAMNSNLTSISNSEQNYNGMSDAEEMRRSGNDIGNSEGLGEVYVDYSGEIRELGLIAEG